MKAMQSPTTSRLKLQRSLAMARTTILASHLITPMQKLYSARSANEVSSRLRKS